MQKEHIVLVYFTCTSKAQLWTESIFFLVELGFRHPLRMFFTVNDLCIINVTFLCHIKITLPVECFLLLVYAFHSNVQLLM